MLKNMQTLVPTYDTCGGSLMISDPIMGQFGSCSHVPSWIRPLKNRFQLLIHPQTLNPCPNYAST